MSKDLHVVFGASGNAGSAIIRELVRRKLNVRGVNRSGIANVPEGVEMVKADILNKQESKLAIKDASIIYNCVNVPYNRWMDDLIPLTKAFIDLGSGNGIKSVIIDNLYMYGRKYNEPLREDMEPLAQSRKGKIRAEITKLYLQAHNEGKINVIFCRASDFYGPGVINSTMGARIMTKVLQGKKIAVLYNPDVPHSFSFVNDYAKAVINLVNSDDVFGQIWHIPTAEPITQREFLEIAFEIANKTPKITSLSNVMLNMVALFNPIVKEIKELSYQFEKPFIMDHSKYEKKFGLNITPHKEAIETTLKWYAKEYLN